MSDGKKIKPKLEAKKVKQFGLVGWVKQKKQFQGSSQKQKSIIWKMKLEDINCVGIPFSF